LKENNKTAGIAGLAKLALAYIHFAALPQRPPDNLTEHNSQSPIPPC
jgi:hypothetical protein